MAAMEFHLLPAFALFCLVLVRSNASMLAEEYWHSMLPNTPMPQEVQKLLQPDTGDKSSFWDMGLNVDQTLMADRDADKRKKYGIQYNKDFVENMEDKRKKYGIQYNQDFVDDKRKKYGIQYNQDLKKDVDDKRATNGKGLDRKRYENKFHKYALPNSTVFFLYNDLYAGKKMKLHITKSTNKAKFLARKVADSIPFSSNKLVEILEQLSVKPESLQARIIKETIKECESAGIKGEDKFCPTTLEALLDFVVAHIGNKAQVFYNEIDKPTKVKEYTIMGVKMVGENQVVCHKENYPYAVYYCHAINATKVYMAPLVGVDGTKAKAVAVCHSDTSNWNPGHLAFLMLNIKPGDGTICHFIRSNTLVWASN